MKNLLLCILYSQLIYLSFSIVPIWNFENSAINLFLSSNEDSYILCSRKMYDLEVKLERKLTKSGNTITQKNIIYIYNDKIGEVSWEDIESFYRINGTDFICPKGRYHMHFYKENDFIEVKPDTFSEEEDWDLQCYYQKDQKYMFVAFINKHPKIYSLKIDTWIWEEIEFNDGLYDFKWVTAPINGEYPMKAIILENNLITLKGRTFHINGADNTITYEDKQEKSFIKILSNSISYFKLDNENFYFMTYDSADNFISGFYNEKDIDYNNIKNIEPTINTISPLEFFNEVDIIYLKFIRNTKYAFYKIRDKKDDIIYHGIIDILLNKVIFNTNEEILEFKPYSSNSMLAKTSNSAYKICTIQDNGNCIDQCSNSFTIFDVSKPNQCGNEINCKNYILIPNEICIESCDENIYTKIDNKCGLCRDMDENKPYKLLNSIGCVDIKLIRC